MLRVRTVMSGLASSPYLNTFYSEGTTEGEAATFADAVNDFWIAIAGAVATPQVIQTDSAVFVINEATGDTVDVFDVGSIAPIPATGAEAVLPLGVAPVLQLRTGVYVNGREVRGRTFLPGFTVNQVGTDTGEMTSGSKAYIDTRAENLLLAAPGWCVWSRTNGTLAPISRTEVATKLGMIRSRRD